MRNRARRWFSPPSSCIRCCTSSRRSSRCGCGHLDPDRPAGTVVTTSAASSGRRCCSSPGCSSWSARSSRPASSARSPGRRSNSPAGTRCSTVDADPRRFRAGVGHHRQHSLRRDHDADRQPSSPPACPDVAHPERAVVGARPRRRFRRQPDRCRSQRQRRHARNRPPLRTIPSRSGSSPARASWSP